MKSRFQMPRDVITRGSILTIAVFSISVLVENGCSDSSSPGSPAAADAATGGGGCIAGETLTQVGKQTLCCSGTAPTLVCHDNGGRVGDPCSASSFPASDQTVNVTLDVCVTDSCNGDRNPVTYDAQTIATTTPLACTNGTLVEAGEPATHEVDRVCADVAPLVCAGRSYSYYGYVTTYGYGYYGGAELKTRKASVSSSVCTTANSAPTACDVGDL